MSGALENFAFSRNQVGIQELDSTSQTYNVPHHLLQYTLCPTEAVPVESWAESMFRSSAGLGLAGQLGMMRSNVRNGLNPKLELRP